MTTIFTMIALAFFPLTVIYAGIGDLTTMRIPNRLVLAMLVGYAMLAPLAGFSISQLALGLATACIVFFLAFGAFAMGWMGGGDVKLMAVAALWLGLPQLAAFLLWTSLAGAVLTLSLMVYRSLPLSKVVRGFGWASRLHTNETRVPYGVAIASASLIVFTASPWMALR
jgi:prepilin peptidase CpaA